VYIHNLVQGDVMCLVRYFVLLGCRTRWFMLVLVGIHEGFMVKGYISCNFLFFAEC
jgi:hypothetical protein